MFFRHIYEESLAQGSYMVGCQATGETIVIDAKRDVDTYLRIAEEEGLRITHLTETHIHADFLSGTRELAALTGAPMYLSDEGGEDWQYEFDHIGLRDGDKIEVGNLTLEVIHTPGHTPESISFILTDKPATNQPVMIFTGDFVFVGDIGRPDLLEKAGGIKNSQHVGADQMWNSLPKFTKLPDYVQVWPGHGAGSACGKALGAVPSSTIGYEEIRNWAFQHKNEQEFKKELLSNQPEPPKYFAKMKVLNKVERPLLTEVPRHEKLSKEKFLEAYERGVKIIDTRDKGMFDSGFLPGSINIQGTNSFNTWMGWLVDYDEPFILVAQDDELEELTRMLMRIGMDNMYGYINTVDDLDIPLEQLSTITIDKMKEMVKDEDVQIVDVRGISEYEEAHIEGATHAFLGTLEHNLDKIDKHKKKVVHCKGGDRAAIAISLLNKHDFKQLHVYYGGMDEWQSQGMKTVSKNLAEV